jgi:VIT1/CCC1 family predicted Fe2+/Mn2+ transporter
LAPKSYVGVSVTLFSLIVLAALGAIAARTGGAGMLAGAFRVLAWGVFAFAATAGIGALLGTVV